MTTTQQDAQVERIIGRAIGRALRAEVDPVLSFDISHRMEEKKQAISEAVAAIAALLTASVPPQALDTGEVEALNQRAEAASQRAATAESRLYSYSQHRAARFKVLVDLVQSRAPDLWPDYAALSANGSLYTDGNWIEPTYERAMNTLRHRAEAAEEEATKLRALAAPSPTNP